MNKHGYRLRTWVMILWIITFTGVHDAVSQKQITPRDTSYTVSSTLLKVRKSHPDVNITPALPAGRREVIARKDVVYKVLEQRELKANIFFRDTIGAPQPAIIMIHGGGWRTGDKSLMTPMAERLAFHHYAAFAPEYRLSLEAAYPAALQDIYDVVDWMYERAKEFNVDTTRIVVMGCSAGGQLAALVGTTILKKRNRSVAAIIDVDGILAFKHDESQEGTMASQWLGGTYEQVPHRWVEASALTHVDEHTPPTLFLGSMYPRFLAGRKDFVRQLDSYGIPSQTKILEGAPHSFWLFHPWYEQTIETILDFLKNQLR